MSNIYFEEVILHYASKPGSSIGNVVKELLEAANTSRLPCMSAFNDTDVVVRPDGCSDKIEQTWWAMFENRAGRLSYQDLQKRLAEIKDG